MKKTFKHLYEKSDFVYPVKAFYDFFRWHLIPEKVYASWIFEKNMGYKLNLKDPKTFNEKLQWLKFNDRDPLKALCADKYAVRNHIKKTIGDQYLIPLFFHTEDPNDIVPENLPDTPCIIKTNHASGDVFIVRDKSQIDFDKVQRKLRILLRKNHYDHTKEWQYKNIRPRILVEKLLVDENSNVPLDYKFNCFNGEITFITAHSDRFVGHKSSLYDPDWNPIDCRCNETENVELLAKPQMFETMKELAKTLSKDFVFVRVDLYNIGTEIYFGELTFCPGSGWAPFEPVEWDRKFGDLLVINKPEETPVHPSFDLLQQH
jgi:hypothetical protein